MTAEIIDFSSGRTCCSETVWQSLLRAAREPATGDYAGDCASGHLLADAVAAYVIANEFPPAIGYIADCLTAGAPLTGRGRQVGFFHRLAETLISSAKAEAA
jgi:hypothetical protein